MKFLLVGYFGFGNFGDEAILKYAVNILRFYYKDSIITAMTQTPELTKKLYDINTIYRFDLKTVINEIKTCDYLIFPGGSILQDTTSIKSIIYYLSLIFLAKFFKKKVIMISQGIGPINNVLAQKITCNLLKKVDFISVRDEKSKELLLTHGINVQLTADLIWAFTHNNVKEQEKTIVYGDIACHADKGKVGIQLRNWKSLTSDKLEILAKSILKQFPIFEFDYKLICLQKNADEDVLIEFGKIMHDLNPDSGIELCIVDNIESNIELLQSMDYMIAMRFHAGLCTINAEKPLLMISYDPKTEELCNELGLRYIDVNKIDEKSLADGIKWLKEFNPTKTALKTNIFTKKAQENVDFLIKEIEK